VDDFSSSPAAGADPFRDGLEADVGLVAVERSRDVVGSRLPDGHPRPCHRPAEQRDELALIHSITSSARASTLARISMPSTFAVLRLITSSYLVGACTGRSAGFSPLRIWST
jgi:hypothetical protein